MKRSQVTGIEELLAVHWIGYTNMKFNAAYKVSIFLRKFSSKWPADASMTDRELLESYWIVKLTAFQHMTRFSGFFPQIISSLFSLTAARCPLHNLATHFRLARDQVYLLNIRENIPCHGSGSPPADPKPSRETRPPVFTAKLPSRESTASSDGGEHRRKVVGIFPPIF